MKYLLPLWILINCRLCQVLGVLEWTVIGKVTEYGHNVTLFCNVSNCCPQDSGWDQYTPQQRTLFIDVKTGRSNKKYDGKVSGDGYTLIIQNLTKSDLNVSYACVYGVTIGEIKFLLEEDVFTYISTTHSNVSTGKSQFSEGEIAALIVGVSALVAVPIFIYVWKRRKKRKTKNNGENQVSEELEKLIPELSAPVGPMEISNITESSVDIAWKAPELDGGASITKYLIEYRLANVSTWEKAGNVDGTTYNFSVKDLTEGEDFYFKVTAINSKGPGSPLESEDLVKLNALPEATCINRLPEADRLRYIKLMQSSKTERRYFVKIMIVGKESVGKTCLLRRLLREKIGDVSSTDGIDIVVRRCIINRENGKWKIEKDIPDDTGDRIQRAITQNQSTQDQPNENIKSEVPKKDMSEVAETFKKPLVIEAEPEKHDDISNNSTLTTSQLECSKPTVDNMNVETTDITNISLENVTLKTNDTNDTIETVENNSESNLRDTIDVTSTETVRTSNENELHQKDISEYLGTSNLISDVFATISTSNSLSYNYALCGLWDFAGQKEFYCTHQAFLTSSAIYLVVADMKTDILTEKQNKGKTGDDVPSFSDLHEEDYVDFWFDNIHCYQTDDRQEGEPSIDPPVIVVFTGKDQYEKKSYKEMQERQIYLGDKLTQLFGTQEKYQHYRHKFYVSNTEDPDAIFEQLRDKISELAQKMQLWGESVPLKWILLERVINENKKRGVNFITHDDIIKIAKLPEIAIYDNKEVLTFLHFQNEVGKIVFFKDIPDLIILEPQWLANAFRCLVSDRFDIDKVQDVSVMDKAQISFDWVNLKTKGEISDLLINTLFKLKGGVSFLKQKKHLLEVMEKFDILLEIKGKHAYLMPSMFPSSSFETVCKSIGIVKDNCQRTSWFCMKFKFLPPSFFNHLSVWLMSKYSPTEVKSTNAFALYRGFCGFDLNKSDCVKLLMTMSIDTIALQIVSFANHTKDLVEECTSVRRDLRKKIIDIKKRYRIAVTYEQQFKCSDCPCHADAKSFETLKEHNDFFCHHHRASHESATVCFPWATRSTESLSREEMDQEHKEILHTSLEYIVMNLHDVERICEYLEVDDILIEEDLTEIKHNKSKQTRALLYILPYRGKKAYASFIEALKRTENTFVADYLGQDDGSTDWPDLKTGLMMVKKRDIQKCSEKSFRKICESRQVYNMTRIKKGKFLMISNVQCIKQYTDTQSPNDTELKSRSRIDFDKTSILQLFKHMQYESKGADVLKDVSGYDMKMFLQDNLKNKENSSFDSLVIVIFSGGDKYKPRQIYDKYDNEIENKEIFSIIQESPAFAGKPKVVIISTYNFEETETYDDLDVEKQELHFYDKGSNNKDLFVVSSQPRTKKGPWIIGEGMNGSYFMQALIHVFKKMAHEKSFLEMMKEANACLLQAVVPNKKDGTVDKTSVAQIVLLEYCEEKELYFFPGLSLMSSDFSVSMLGNVVSQPTD
ncbi:uncharacterized protein LOC127720206 isoform X2 [Mytilus californianus]|uniref:uncharacterized protein LOC127720206 isoform X2 n=1 Tax=Mytilus californianus TaxID=6549 RepID=UPI002245EA48|nr:uncharacterized protein LOC127720206 isoform X2 [Mytilus californianus]